MKESTTFSITLACLAAVTAPATAAQTPREPVTTVIRAARMLDVASGQLLRNVSVVVTGDRITAVNPTASPPGAQVVDLGDVTLLPGFIDLHTHLTGEIGPTTFIEPVLETGVDAAFKAARHGRTTVMAGFTTVRDFGGDVTVAMGKAVDRGDVTGPRIVPSRDALGITGGHCDVTGFAPGILEQGPKNGVADGPWAVIEAVRYQIKHGAQVIKTCATAGVLSMEGPVGAQQYSYEELKAMVDEAARHGIKVAAASDYVPGPFEPLMAIQSMVTRKDIKGRVWGDNQKIKVAEALRICTIHGAHASFEEKHKGSITPGKLADFVMLGADPHSIDPDKIKEIKVVRTVVGGKTVHPKSEDS